jgi:hypothetical protein
MRMGKSSIVMLTVLWLMLLGTPSWGGVQYLGESTWRFSITMDDDGPVSSSMPMAAAITHMGGTYFTMQGYLILPDGDGPFIMAGGGVLIGETLYLSMAGSQHHTDGSGNRDTTVIHIELNKTTLNGTFYGVGNDFNISPDNYGYGDHFAAGTFTRTGDLINLDANPSSIITEAIQSLQTATGQR